MMKVINGKQYYLCNYCKKWKPVFYVTNEEWKKLPVKYHRSTLCEECYKKITKHEPKQNMLLGGNILDKDILSFFK